MGLRRRLAVDWRLVEHRRIAAGLSRRALVERVGLGALTGSARLWAERDHDQVRLGLLKRLCAVLDLRARELFKAHSPADDQEPALAPDEDGAALEAALLTLSLAADGPVSRAEVAEALGWGLARLEQAVAALCARLEGTGVRLDSGPPDSGGALHGLRPRDGLLDRDQRTALHRLAGLRDSLTETAARVLYEIAVCGLAYRLTDTPPEEAAVILLERHGLVRHRPGSDQHRPTEDLRFCLMLDEPNPIPRSR